MNLSRIFTSIVYKKLVMVDLPDRVSNQHEINGTVALRNFFNTSEPISGLIQWHYFSDEEEPLNDNGNFTFYDARADDPHRTEWRMYYQGQFLDNTEPGDILILARKIDGTIYGLVFQQDSAWLRIAQTLFDLEEISPTLQFLPQENLNKQELELSQQYILEELGIEIKIPASDLDEELAHQELKNSLREGRNFPSTRRMSELAWLHTDVNINNADETLIRWLSREEQLFRAIEGIIVSEKLKTGFESVDEFIGYSLSVQNRRKSRMGSALENHLAQLFRSYKLRFETEKVTEGRNKPDFLFPGSLEYNDSSFEVNLLVMLGAKSSCKERWRQILTEANRIAVKHLCTLEQAISEEQTDEMRNQRVQLILPDQFHNSYSDKQQKEIWNIRQFIDFVRLKQSD